jgi:hypothetical protein
MPLLRPALLVIYHRPVLSRSPFVSRRYARHYQFLDTGLRLRLTDIYSSFIDDDTTFDSDD